MRVLDIDLDFFLADCCPLADIGMRPVLSGHEPWSDSDVRLFLENNCGLTRPVRGRIFDTHDKALYMWNELVNCGELTVPFSVTHIDAHSDLGIGFPGTGFVLNTVISTRPDMRTDIRRYTDMNELDEANYLLFAIAMRYVKELVNVRNPKSRRDIPREIIQINEQGNFNIKLQSYASNFLESINGQEPSVLYNEYNDYTKYKTTEGFDFISLAMSPRYAPEEADGLAQVIGEYIERM